jgi:putative heme-binding domain-containing protein
MNCSTLVSQLRTAVVLPCLVCLVALAAPHCTAPLLAAELKVSAGDHICLVGNTLAERMQHHGWLETLLHSRFADERLVVRNLGFSGDEITLRLRSANFGSPDEHLTRLKADTVFLFFGYNESFAGDGGLEKFKTDLRGMIEQMRSQKYNGRSAPQLVLFSPIAHENLRDPNLPDGSQNNARLERYTQAMAEVAEAFSVPFVDLFHPSLEIYAESKEPLTDNGIHLNELGDRLLAAAIEKALFPGGPQIKRDAAQLARLRSAVLDKNFYWFHRHRTTDGYSIYGGRADLKFVDGQTNREVMQREMEVLDAMAANRDEKIWSVAAGKDLKIDDSNTPPFVDVVTNKPGPLPGGKHLFLGGEESIRSMTVAKGMRVNLFASEEQFPELVNPVQMAFDTRGRLWVAAWLTYPHWKPKEAMNDKLLILEDTDGDGQADRSTVFADDLHNPTGFEFWGDGVLVAMSPYLLFLKDTDGDNKADYRERVLGGLDSADTHHTANSFILDPGGALYFQEGTFHHSQVETPYGPAQRVANGAVFRYEPRSRKFDVYVSYGFANPHGHAFDPWGQDIIVDGTGAVPYHGTLISGHVNFPQKHGRAPQVYQQRTRPCPGIEYLSSRHFPEANQGNLLVANVIGFQGILQYKVQDKDSSFTATELEPIVSSNDPNFRPVDLEVGPDGALYFTDWQNPIIGHMQHNLRDPSRDRSHGRVYRVTAEGRPLLKPEPIAGQSIEKLLGLLKSPEARVRYRAKIELSGRPSAEVIAAMRRWTQSLDQQDADYEHHLLEALWLHQHHNEVDVALLERLLSSPDFRARAAATRVLCYWRDRVSNTLDLLRKLAADDQARVRLEAVRAASFVTMPEAVEIVEIARQQSMDPYLEYLAAETLKTLDPLWKAAIANGAQLHFTTDAGARFLVRNVNAEQLLAMPRNRIVYQELLVRPGLQDAVRAEGVRGLAKLDNKSEPQVVMEVIRSLDEKNQASDTSVVFDLVRQLTGRSATELATVRAELEKLALAARQPVFRQIGYVSLIEVDHSVEAAWKLASRSVEGLRDIVNAMPLVPDASVQATLYDRVEPLVHGLPPSLSTVAKNRSVMGRFVRIELPRRGTLTLVEVEVQSDGRNVARQGRASQKNNAQGGDARRAIDGKHDGRYGAGTSTHTEENTNNPWWEVDLGKELPVEAVIVYNRTEGELGKRLEGFTLKVLDASRREVFRQDRIAAPKTKAEVAVSGGDPATSVRHAAMLALTYVRGQELKTFETLAPLVRSDRDRAAAIAALRRIPHAAWPKDQAQPLLAILLETIAKTPASDRTSPASLDALEFSHALASLLPAGAARKARAQLNELGVRVVRLGTLLERMSYDKEMISVKAGKPVEIVFENSDLMPHNFVIAKPGSLEELGLMAEATAQQPDAARRQFVPKSPQVLLGSSLLQPRQSEKLNFTAPQQPGVYPYVCTYPGHWRRMYGALYVVEDLDAYLEDPEGYLAAHPLEIKDPLLANRRSRTEWKFEDLASSVEELSQGRSFGNARQMFQVANCVACHKLNGIGNQFGPDLAKLDPKLKRADILRELLDPSARINEKFQTFIFETDSGRIVTGLVVEENKSTVKIIENPLAKAQPTVLNVAEIVTRQKSPASIMPKGLLDKLSREEILDLVAYVLAQGSEKDPLFRAGGTHQHGHHH